MNTPLHLFTLISADLYRGVDSEILQLFLDAGLVVKLVLMMLFLMSVISWSIIIFKLRSLGKAERQTKEFYDVLEPKKDWALIYSDSRHYTASPIVRIFRAGYNEFSQMKKVFAGKTDIDSQLPPLYGGDQRSIIERALRRATTSQITRLERYLSFLATTGNSAPFIGLFGTVWGIMEAFQEIGQKGATSLAIVAPGISEALIATAAGLFAAIPAVIAYNYFLSRIKRLVAEMDNFSNDFINSVERYHQQR